MTLETFFAKFALFADAPDAVAKMREPSANGAAQASPGQRPGLPNHKTPQALKGRDKSCASFAVSMFHPAGWVAPSGLDSFSNAIPRALPWAGLVRPFGAQILSANGAAHASLGQRPRNSAPPLSRALKGRPNA